MKNAFHSVASSMSFGCGRVLSDVGRLRWRKGPRPAPLVSPIRLGSWLAAAVLLGGCASTGVNLGVSIPIGPNVGIGVGVGSDGRVSTGVGVSVGAGRVSVGTSGRLPNRAAPEAAAAASAPAPMEVNPQSKN